MQWSREGADAVLPAEKVEVDDSMIMIVDNVAQGRNIGCVGEDIVEGRTILQKGRRLRPQDVGLLASIGAAAIPMAGLVMITVILTAVNLPLEGVGLILAVDRILDMFRTATNVWSDSCGAVIIAKSEGERLKV